MRSLSASLVLSLACFRERPADPLPVKGTALSPLAEPKVPPRPDSPPLVTDAGGLPTHDWEWHDWEWIELRGRLIQAASATSPKAFSKIELDDGARVTVTYGAPPPGWEGLDDQRISAVGLMALCGRLEGGQSVIGPHLAVWEAPERLGEPRPPRPARWRLETSTPEHEFGRSLGAGAGRAQQAEAKGAPSGRPCPGYGML